MDLALILKKLKKFTKVHISSVYFFTNDQGQIFQNIQKFCNLMQNLRTQFSIVLLKSKYYFVGENYIIIKYPSILSVGVACIATVMSGFSLSQLGDKHKKQDTKLSMCRYFFPKGKEMYVIYLPKHLVSISIL